MYRAFVIGVALFGGGCHDEAVERLQRIKDEVCACKTPGCGEAAMKQVPTRETKASRQAQLLAHQMVECMSKLYLKDQPSTDPDDEVTSPGSADPASARTP